MSAQLQMAILTFHSLLKTSWAGIFELGQAIAGRTPADFVADWMQASWEMVVEAAISPNGTVFLEPYGEGADCNDIGSRVWCPGAVSTHAVYCVSREGDVMQDVLTEETRVVPPEGYAFDQFVRRSENGWYCAEPPFDYVLLFRGDKEMVVRMEEIDFTLRKIS